MIRGLSLWVVSWAAGERGVRPTGGRRVRHAIAAAVLTGGSLAATLVFTPTPDAISVGVMAAGFLLLSGLVYGLGRWSAEGRK